MNVRHQSAANASNTKLCILLMDGNSERRALRSRILTLHGVEVVGACDLTEAASIWNHDRYDMVLLDIRRDYHGCLAWRDVIKREKPAQIVAFLVGGPRYVDLTPRENSYIGEAHAMEWSDSLRLAIRKSCESLLQRNGLGKAVTEHQTNKANRLRGVKQAAIAGLNGKMIDDRVVNVNEARPKKVENNPIESQMRRHRRHRY